MKSLDEIEKKFFYSMNADATDFREEDFRKMFAVIRSAKAFTDSWAEMVRMNQMGRHWFIDWTPWIKAIDASIENLDKD